MDSTHANLDPTDQNQGHDGRAGACPEGSVPRGFRIAISSASPSSKWPPAQVLQGGGSSAFEAFRRPWPRQRRRDIPAPTRDNARRSPGHPRAPLGAAAQVPSSPGRRSRARRYSLAGAVEGQGLRRLRAGRLPVIHGPRALVLPGPMKVDGQDLGIGPALEDSS